MKKFLSVMMVLSIAISAFAIQIKNSGRGAIQYSLKNGSLPVEVKNGSDCYLDDFAFPYKNRKDEAVSVFVQQEKAFAYQNGDENNIQIAIKANSSEFFPGRDVNYVIFVSNPAFIATEKGRAVFSDSVGSILASKGTSSALYFYIAETEKLASVTTAEELEKVLDELALSEKSTDMAASLETIAKISSDDATLPWKVLCVSEQDMFKNEIVENCFFQLPFTYSNIDFAYLGYGVPSDWKRIGDRAEKLDVSIYYENTYQSLTSRIAADFEKVSHVQVENLEVRIVYPFDVHHMPKLFKLGNLGVNESHVLLEQVAIPSLISLRNPEAYSAEEGFCYANCSVKYELEGKVFYKTYPLTVQYSENPEEIENSKNEIVSKNATIKQSANLFFYVEKLMDFNMENQALAEINRQISALEKIYETCPDRQLEVEIENLKMLKEIILKK
ncbi:MAG: hypothetical protein K6G52_00505 [Treponemataceae bacterium]|nr:hypothetical protein [Treponemataceae bacterium]